MENQALKQTSEKRAALLEKSRQMKPDPGVYLMKDSNATVLYVGKAKNLKNRLITYFQSPVHDQPRIELLVSRVEAFEVILTETESEALILEATLIKKHKPKFNIRLKDDKAYPYLKIQISDPFPKLEWTRRVLRDGARYFGPFPSAATARQVMHLLNTFFKLRDCSENTFRNRSRPCLLYQMGKCTGPCVGLIQPQSYRESISEVIRILEGKSDPFIASLRKGMEEASKNEEYELAAHFRDQIKNLELITQTQGVFEAGSHRDRDVLGLARQSNQAHGTLLQIRNGKLISVQHYHFQNADLSVSDAEILYDFASQYYLALKTKKSQEAKKERMIQTELQSSGTGNHSFPNEVLLPFPGSSTSGKTDDDSWEIVQKDLELLERIVGVQFRTKETAIDDQLLNLAHSNAQNALEQAGKFEISHGIRALEEVQEKLHLSRLPHRMECYDISNIAGEDAVASRVVFIDGTPDKNLYRRYKIKTVEGANDFAMMKEVLGRRFLNPEEDLPDLVVVDGGKGQLAQAVAILDELAVQGVGVVGLAKAKVESDFQSSEIKSSQERIFIPNRKNPVHLLPHTAAFRLLTHIRDEAHRFAVSYHRVLRSKRSLRSDL